MGEWRAGVCLGERRGWVTRGGSQPGPGAEVGGWLEEVAPLGDSQRSSGTGGY